MPEPQGPTPPITPPIKPPAAEPLAGGRAHALGVHHVFVYGTLRRGEVNDINRLHPSPRWCGHARVAGALYQLGWYPGLRFDGDGQVIGEVYAIDPALEPQLDAIEEVRGSPDDEYRKVVVTVEMADAPQPGPGEPPPTRVRALAYEVQAHRVHGAARIASGDWLQR